MSLITIVQDACAELSLPSLTSVVGNSIGNAPIMLRIAKEELNSLATRYEWQALRAENTFSATATAVQVTASAIPTNFDRMVNESFFNRTTKRRVWGPLSSDEWQNVQAHSVLLVDPSYYIRGGTILLTPAPTAGDTFAYEYISNLCVYSMGTATTPDQTYFQNDADTSIFDELMVARGVRWRFLSQKKLDYTQEYQTWISLVQREVSRNKGMPVLNAAATPWSILGGPYVPDMNFPG